MTNVLKGNTMRSEHTANLALAEHATERARWAAVLARPAGFVPATRQPVRRSLLARLFGL